MAQAIEAEGGAASKAHAAFPGVDNATLGFWIFLSAESILFASLIGTYILLHTQTNGGPAPRTIFDLRLTFVGTIALLLSSLTMVLAYYQVVRGRLSAMRGWLVVTIALGLVFLLETAYEFAGFWAKGLTLQVSPFGSAFYTLVGFHAMHVTFGVFWISSLLAYSFKPQFPEESVTKVGVMGLYWHFVDVVWVVIFSVVYLLGKAV
ncbi:MAG: cytochrome c oxidase subunit 3 [Firmicutes bacterium]|nr:cytochrome c oxidase subunit 3 [Bacillota bacterium]